MKIKYPILFLAILALLFGSTVFGTMMGEGDLTVIVIPTISSSAEMPQPAPPPPPPPNVLPPLPSQPPPPPNVLPPSTFQENGACCYTSGGCKLTNQDDCKLVNGTFQQGGQCGADNTCPPPPPPSPVQNQSSSTLYFTNINDPIVGVTAVQLNQKKNSQTQSTTISNLPAGDYTVGIKTPAPIKSTFCDDGRTLDSFTIIPNKKTTCVVYTESQRIPPSTQLSPQKASQPLRPPPPKAVAPKTIEALPMSELLREGQKTIALTFFNSADRAVTFKSSFGSYLVSLGETTTFELPQRTYEVAVNGENTMVTVDNKEVSSNYFTINLNSPVKVLFQKPNLPKPPAPKPPPPPVQTGWCCPDKTCSKDCKASICFNDDSCYDNYHYECVGKQCIKKTGTTGANLCTDNASCQKTTHSACVKNGNVYQCKDVPGGGSNLCTKSPDSCKEISPPLCKSPASCKTPSASTGNCPTGTKPMPGACPATGNPPKQQICCGPVSPPPPPTTTPSGPGQ